VEPTPKTISHRLEPAFVLRLLLSLTLGLSACQAGTIRFDPATDSGGNAGTSGNSGSSTTTTPPGPTENASSRGMWVWSSAQVLASNANQSALIDAAAQAQVTDLYLFVEATVYQSDASQLQTFIAEATNANVRVWALDGSRVYFDDAKGPSTLYEGVANLIAYNQQAAQNERFYGFQADDEPQDGSGYTTFHDNIADSALNTAAGSGVWKSTQAEDREALMEDWLTIHTTLQSTLHAAGLRFGVAMPSWLDNYYGAPVQVSFPAATSPRQGVMQSMMNIADEYVVMSYNTDANAAANLTSGPALYASGFPTGFQPWVYGAVETTPGQGIGVSYADTPGKDSRTAVTADINTITTMLGKNAAFHGMVIEQWSAWSAMPQ
jgi:hypothetical protein